MFPVVVSDLDGTLLNKNHQLSARTKDVVQRLSARGVKFVFATGRHFLDVDKLRSDLGIEMYLITSNGARVHNLAGEKIFEHNIDEDLVPAILSYRHQMKNKARSNVYQENSWFIEEELPELLEFSAHSRFKYQVCDFDAVPSSQVQKIFFVSREHDYLKPLSDDLAEKYGDRLSLTYSMPHCFEIMGQGISKASALEEVLKLKGCEFRDAIAFGDGMNDVEMLSAVGRGVLMGNADERLVAALPNNEQTGFSDEDAVANYLASLYGI